jgi:hypothetical protein
MGGWVVVGWKECLWDGRVGGGVDCDHIGWVSNEPGLKSPCF